MQHSIGNGRGRLLNPRIAVVLTLLAFCTTFAKSEDKKSSAEFPDALVKFKAYPGNPIFEGAGPGHWDAKIRERGWIVKEGDRYRLWYTGYADRAGPMYLGYATSPDGLKWTRHPGNPLTREHWIEDVMIVKDGSQYIMVAEGKDDIAHWLTSPDGLQWTSRGPLDIRMKNGSPISLGPRGTPVLFKDVKRWLLYYERGDLGIWVAESTDLAKWTNVSDDPVIACGPEFYDQHAVALNQIVPFGGRYYAYYHASDSKQKGRLWSSCVAMSTDLVHWKKYSNNPILRDNKSSPILVHDGQQFRLYTMHEKVQVHFPEP